MKKAFEILAYVCLGIFMLSCGEAETKKQAAAPLDVKAVAVTVEDVPLYAEFVGQTYGYFDIAIRARVEGFLEGRSFQEGSEVKKGQLLYQIDQQPFQAKVATQQSGLAQAKTALVKAQSDLNRIRPLAETKAVSQSDLDAAVAQFEAAEAEVAAAEASLRLSRIELGYTRIYAPISGIIGMTKAKVGDFVGREPNPVVLNTVSRIDTIQVRFSITEANFIRLTRFVNSLPPDEKRDNERNLELILSDGSVFEYKGKFDFADRSVNPTTGTILLQASFPNPEGVLRPGQFARVKAMIHKQEKAVLIPKRCLTELQGRYSVQMIQKDGTIKQRAVTIGPEKGNMQIITKGLEKGDVVVLEGLQMVRPDMKVTPVITEFKRVD